MTTRERSFAGILVLILVGGGGVILAERTYFGPARTAQRTIDKLDDETEQKRRQVNAVLQEKKSVLERGRLIGLPGKMDAATSEYGKFLKDLLKGSGLTVDDFQGPPPTDPPRPAPGAPKKAGHVSLSFQVRAQGEWSNVVRFLDRFHKAPFLHKIKTMTMDRPQLTAADTSTKVGLIMTVEALIVSGSDNRPDNLWGVDVRLVAADALSTLHGGPAGLGLVLRGPALLLPERPKRAYADLEKHNPFVGPAPPAKPPEVVKKAPPPAPPAGPDIREDIRLMSVTASEGKALLRNLGVVPTAPRKANITLSQVPNSGYESFRIYDEEQDRDVVKGRVLRVDHRDVYFKTDSGKIYGIHIGQTMAEAMREPLSAAEVERLGLSGGPEEKGQPEGGRKGKTGKGSAP